MNTKSLATVALGLAILNFICINQANATPISNVTASTDMGQFTSFNLQDTVNGSGLSEDAPNSKGKAIEGKPASDTAKNTVQKHIPSGTSNSWFSNPAQSTGTIDFNLNNVYELTGFDYWNASGEAAPNGIRNVTISTSIDGVNFTALEGAPTQFAQASSSTQTQLPQSFSWKSVRAQYVRLQVRSNFMGKSGSASGFSEIQFQTLSVPVIPAAADGGAIIPSGLAAGVGLLDSLLDKSAPPAMPSIITTPSQSPTPTPSPRPSTGVPTPALLPGLVGMGITVFRKRHRKVGLTDK